MTRSRVFTGILFLSLLVAVAYGQTTRDPFLGNYMLGNSAEMVLLRFPFDQDSIINTLFDCLPGLNPVSAFGINDFAGSHSFDVAMADVDGDGKEEAGAVWRGSDGSLVLSVSRFTRGTVGLEQRVVTPLPGTPARTGPVRILRGLFHDGPCDEFAIGYWNTDETIRIMIVDVDSTTLTPTVRGQIGDVTLPSSLAEDAYFDVAAGDFDRDGLDEIFLTKVNAHADCTTGNMVAYVNTHLYCCVYDYDPVAALFTHHASVAFDVSRMRVVMSLFGVTSSDTRTGGLAATAGDYRGDGRDEPLVCWSGGAVLGSPLAGSTPYGELMAWPLQVSENLDTLQLLANGLISCDVYAPTDITDATSWGLWPVCAASADLNGDGSDELVTGGLRNVCVYRPDNVGRFTLFATRPVPIYGAWLGGTSHRMLAIADVDADTLQSHWTPELVVTLSGTYLFTGCDASWEVLGFTVDTTNLSLQNMFVKAEGTINPRNAFPLILGSADWAIALGDVNGDAIRLRNPRRLVRQSVLQPLVVLNALPIHFDDFGGARYDVCKSYNENTGKFTATYEQQTGQTVQFSTEVKSDWGLSSTLSYGGSFLGIGVKGHLTAKYGQGFSKKQQSSQSVTVTETATTRDDDYICATVTDYEYWEYELYRGGQKGGNIVAVIPHLQFPPTRWISGKSWDAMWWYTPRHEVGNILSYIPGGGVPVESDVDTLLHLFTPYQASQKAGMDWEIKFEDFMSSSQESSRNIGFEAGASVSGWGFEASLEGHYDRSELSTATSTATSGVRVLLHVDEIDKGLGDVDYTIGPCVYWAANGALTIDYSVTPATSGGIGLETWWDTHYGHLPDPAFNLPWRLDPEKGYSLGTDAAKRWLSKSIRVSPSVVRPGDRTTIFARVYNYSLVPLTAQVPVRFFVGDPDSGGVPIVGDGGVTELHTVGTIGARAYQNMQMAWTVPLNLSGNVRVFGLIDPDSSLAEVHETNNKGFTALTLLGTSGVTERHADRVPGEFALFQNYPNPLNPSTVIRFAIPRRTHVSLKVYDLLGREVQTLLDAERPAGVHTAWFDGSRYATGVYFYRLEAGKFVSTRKLLLLK